MSELVYYLEKSVGLDMYQIRGEVPHIFSVVNNANHSITTREQSPAMYVILVSFLLLHIMIYI